MGFTARADGRARRWRVVGAAAGAITLTACGGEQSPAATPTTTVAPATSTTVEDRHVDHAGMPTCDELAALTPIGPLTAGAREDGPGSFNSVVRHCTWRVDDSTVSVSIWRYWAPRMPHASYLNLSMLCSGVAVPAMGDADEAALCRADTPGECKAYFAQGHEFVVIEWEHRPDGDQGACRDGVLGFGAAISARL
ncbi:hypothetical protein [Nocardia farcinica]|uniref:hypothetical protein n=1 Tax=Nocardia farcinica TaxID=37329 RepID=UPI0018948806|nr:hypothetical protein [Nocardia farcinica]MBF6143082.1 hypothetical protein [Nocardia farcinica]MBF6382549.1 hypothetical protein [Nocardia farcinica]